MIRAAAFTAALLLSATAFAADMQSPRTSHDWSGTYIGGAATLSSGNFDWHDIDDVYNYGSDVNGGPWDEVFPTSGTGAGGSLQLGYMNYLDEQNLVGIELSLGLPGLKDSRTTCYEDDCHVSSKLSWDGALRLRLGRDYGGFMPYLTGGLAFGGFKHAWDEGINNVSDWPGFSGTSLGWTVGAGGEYALSDNWSLKLEANYISFADKTQSNNFDAEPQSMRVSRNMWQGVLGLNYRFP